MPKIAKRPAILKPEEGIALIPIGAEAKYGHAIVDIEYAEMLEGYWWNVDSNGYPNANPTRGKNIYMHRLILPDKKGFSIDHIDRNILNNRRKNLRHATPHMQSANRSSHKLKTKNRTSQYKGVCRVKNWKDGRWQWAVYSRKIPKGKIYGYCFTELEAAYWYNKYAKKYHGKYAVLNELD